MLLRRCFRSLSNLLLPLPLRVGWLSSPALENIQMIPGVGLLHNTQSVTQTPPAQHNIILPFISFFTFHYPQCQSLFICSLLLLLLLLMLLSLTGPLRREGKEGR